MGFYSKTPTDEPVVGNKKSRGGVFSAGDARNAPSRQAKAPVGKGLCAVGSATFAPGALLYGYRHLSTEIGRWINRDPIMEEGGVNVYGFMGNDPVNKIDYLGMKYYASCSDDYARCIKKNGSGGGGSYGTSKCCECLNSCNNGGGTWPEEEPGCGL